jgi:hypothetical protein
MDVRGGRRKPHVISKMLHGTPGTRVTLTVQRGSAILTIHVVRGHGLDREFVGAYRKALAVQRSVWMRTQDGATVQASSGTQDGVTLHASSRTHLSATLHTLTTVAPPSSSFAAMSVSESESEQASSRRYAHP